MHFNRQIIRSAKIRPFVQSPKLGLAGRSVGLALRELINAKHYTEGKSDLDQLLEELEVVERKKICRNLMAKNSNTHVALTESAPKSNPLAGVFKTLWLQGKQPRDVGRRAGAFLLYNREKPDHRRDN